LGRDQRTSPTDVPIEGRFQGPGKHTIQITRRTA
jgi:hypothetical protein